MVPMRLVSPSTLRFYQVVRQVMHDAMVAPLVFAIRSIPPLDPVVVSLIEWRILTSTDILQGVAAAALEALDVAI